MLDMDSKNAHTFCSRDMFEEKSELNVAFHYMLESFRALYGKRVTVHGALAMARIGHLLASTYLAKV
jgi:hypothetical protein